MGCETWVASSLPCPHPWRVLAGPSFTTVFSRWRPPMRSTSPRTSPFVDGNKRTALNAALVFLDLNGFIVHDPEGRLYDAMIAISSRALDKRGLGQMFFELAQPNPR